MPKFLVSELGKSWSEPTSAGQESRLTKRELTCWMRKKEEEKGPDPLTII